MKRVSYFFFVPVLFLFISIVHAQNNFFKLEHLPQGTKIPVLKLINLIPTLANTPLKNAQVEDVYVQAVEATPAVFAHIELFGKIKLETSLPGLQNIGDLALTFIAKFFSAFGRGAAPVSSPTLLPSSQKPPAVEKPAATETNPLAQAAQAILSELPPGFYLDSTTDLHLERTRQINDPNARAILQVGNKYVMLDPSVHQLSAEQIAQYQKTLPSSPTWQRLTSQSQQPTSQQLREQDIEETIAKSLTTAEELPPARQVFVERYDKAIKELQSLPSNPDAQQLLNRLTTERANLGKPELNLKALTDANTYLKKPEIVATLEQRAATKIGTDRPIGSGAEEQTKTIIRPTQAILPQLPGGENKYTENPQGLLVEKQPEANQPPKVILKSGDNVYVLLDPSTVSEFKTKQQVQQYRDQLERLPEWSGLVREAQIQPYSLAPYIKQAQINIPDSQIQSMMNLGNNVYKAWDSNTIYVKIEGNNYMALTGNVFANPEFDQRNPKSLANAVEKQNLEFQNQKQVLRKTSIPVQETEQKPTTPQPTTGTPLPASEIDIVKARFQKAIGTLSQQLEYAQQLEKAQGTQQPGRVGTQEKRITSLTQQIQALKGEQAYINAAKTITDSDVRNLQILPEVENLTKLPPSPPLVPLTGEHRTLNQQYDDAISALTNLSKKDNNALRILTALGEEQDMIARLSSAPSKTPTALSAAQKYIQQSLQSAAPQIPAKPLTAAQRALNQQYEQTIATIEKLPNPDDRTRALLETLKQEQKAVSALSSPPKVTSALNEAQQHLLSLSPQRLTPDQVVSTRTQINDMVGKLRSYPKTEYITNLINELNYELVQLNRIGTAPAIGEFPGFAKAQRYLAAVGTPPTTVPLKERITTAAERAKGQIAALPGQVKKEYEAARAKVFSKIDSLNKIVSQKMQEITGGGATLQKIPQVGAALFLITLQNPNYRPFQNIQIPDLPPIDIPGIKDIELNNTELGIFLAPPNVFSIWAQGSGRVINIPLHAKVLFSFEKMPITDPKTGKQAEDKTGKKLVAENTGVVLQAGLPEAWKFSDSFPNMKDWDRFVIKRAYVYVSSINYIDYTIPTQLMPSASISIANVPGRPTVGMLPGITIRPGLSLYGEINLRKLIPEIFEHLNFAGLETASLYGTISHKPENCQLGIGLPDLVKIENSPFKLGGVWAEIHMKNMQTTPGGPNLFQPEASIVIALVIKPSPKDETLTFTARASSDSAGGMVAFSMQGFWNNALGVEGLSIGDLALQLHTDYKALLAGIPVSGGGFTGTIKFGTQVDSPIIKMAALYAMTSFGQETAVQGKLDGTISIWQIIDGCKSLAINKAQKDKKPTKAIEDNYNKILNNAVAKQLGNVAIRNVEMKVAPSTVRIGEFFILQGFTAKGELTLLGVTGGLDFNLGQSGLTATGYLSPIKIGDVFSLTGAGMDKQYGTPDDAALMSLAINFMKQHFIITGQVKLLGIEQQTDIFVDTEGINCSISGKIYNMFDASVVLKSRGDITNPDLYFKASMKQQFTKYIIDETTKALRASTQDSVNKIKTAQDEVDKINNNIADLDKQLADRKKRIDELAKTAAAAPTTSPEISKLSYEITGLETAHAGAIASRDAAQKILDGSQDAINKFNAAQQEVNKLNNSVADFENQISSRKKRIDELSSNFLEGVKNAPEITKLGLEITGLETAKAGTVAARDTATGVLSGLSGTATLMSTNQTQINNLNNEIASLNQKITDRRNRINELGKQFVQGAQTTPEITKLGLEITGLETARAGAIASRETAKGALEGAKRWVGGASIIAEAFIKGSVPLDIRESMIEASIQEIAKGKLPRFTAAVSILGKKLNLDMQLDFSSPEKARQSAEAIAQQILTLFK